MNKEKTFEECIKELEKTVKKLENAELSLDDAIKAYQEGLEQSRLCYELFKKAETLVIKKVEGENITNFDVE